MRGKICFDIAALAIMLVVLAYHMRRNVARNNRNFLFFVLVVISIICAGAAISYQGLLLSGSQNGKILTIFEGLDALMLTLIAPCYVFYIMLFTSNEQSLYRHRKLFIAAIIPEVAWIVYLLFFYFYCFYFPSFEPGMYWEMIHQIIFLLLTLMYSIIGLVYLARFRNIVFQSSHMALAVPIILTCFSMMVKSLFWDSQSVLFVIAMCFLMLLLLNRNSSGLIDTNTGFRTQVAFADEIMTAQHIDRQMQIILIKILNYTNAVNRSGYDTVLQSMIKISRRITRLISGSSIDGTETFYNDDGSFIIIVPQKNQEKIDEFADVLAKEVMSGVNLGAVDYALRANVCKASFPDDAEDVDTILLLLDDLGRMSHSLHALSASDITSTEDFKIRRQMNMIIDRGLANGYFSVYYQPIYSLRDNSFASAEALVRLKDPEFGFISPGIFIPIAEKTGAIHKIGSFVFEEVCKFIASDEFSRLGVHYIEVNLSTAQCLRINIVDEIEGIASRYEINPKQINLEITETAECYSQHRLLENVRTLHNDGYTFSLDDFGTGYSNLMRMASIPLNIIKLDRAFVLMDQDEKFHAIIKNMVRLFRQMGLKILVEGVETGEMVEKFRDIDVDYIQGYYYSKPLPKDKYISFVQSHLS